MTKPSSPSRKRLILRPTSDAEISEGAGLGALISEKEGHERLAGYAAECARLKPGEGKGGLAADPSLAGDTPSTGKPRPEL
jgi:hypothetical protein